MKTRVKRKLEASIRSEMESTLRAEIQSNVRAEIEANVHAELEDMFNKRTEEYIELERATFQHQLAENKKVTDSIMASAKKSVEESSKRLDEILKVVTDANAHAERAEKKAADSESQMNWTLERLAEEAQSLHSPLLASRRSVLAITQGQEDLVANYAESASNRQAVNVHAMIHSDEPHEKEMDETEEMELAAHAKRSEGLEGQATAEEANMGDDDKRNADDVDDGESDDVVFDSLFLRLGFRWSTLFGTQQRSYIRTMPPST